MKKLSPVLLLLTAATSFAQQDSLENMAFDMDVYIQVPKFNFSIASRSISGAKSSFSGLGSIATSSDIPLTGTDVVRFYHNGMVAPDARTIDTVNEDGTITSTPIAPDGKTNTWFYHHADQVTPDGNIAMNTYRATTIDAGPRSKDSNSSYGVELAVARNIGKVIARFDWNIGAGLSLNDIRSQMLSTERATVTTLTDVYSLDGVPPPNAPYSAPSQSVEEITNEDGTTTVLVTDTTVLLGNEPISRDTSTEVVDGQVTSNWKLQGAYYTLRAGPTLIFPFSERFRATISAGAAMIYAGTNYTITQTFQPDLGVSVTDSVTDAYSKVLPGYYADAGVEFWLSERAGLFLGAVYQGSGDYTQRVQTENAEFATKVDLSKLQGFRFGMNIKF